MLQDQIAKMLKELRQIIETDEEYFPLPMLGTWIKLKRRRLGKSREDLANKLNITETRLGLLENGHFYTSELNDNFISKLAVELRVDPQKLIEVIDKEIELLSEQCES